ncbi:hypothetical protein SALBM217S_07716 [Streptomyces griseoloalbus]
MPDTVLYAVPVTDGDPAERARQTTGEVLAFLQRWLDDPAFAAAPLVVVTRGAVATGPGDPAHDLPGAAVRAVRSAQTQHPGRLVLVDLDVHDDSWRALPAALGLTGEPQLAIRQGEPYAPSPGPWPPHRRRAHRAVRCRRLAAGHTAEGLRRRAGTRRLPRGDRGPSPLGHLLIEVRAAGLNFRDVLNTLDMYPGPARTLGAEAEVRSPLSARASPTSPPATGSWAWSRVASPPTPWPTPAWSPPYPTAGPGRRRPPCPSPFLTAYYGLRDLARLEAGSPSSCTPRPAASAWPPSSSPATGAPRCTARPASTSAPCCAPTA